jgi:hypothetical protein
LSAKTDDRDSSTSLTDWRHWLHVSVAHGGTTRERFSSLSLVAKP